MKYISKHFNPSIYPTEKKVLPIPKQINIFILLNFYCMMFLNEFLALQLYCNPYVYLTVAGKFVFLYSKLSKTQQFILVSNY